MANVSEALEILSALLDGETKRLESLYKEYQDAKDIQGIRMVGPAMSVMCLIANCVAETVKEISEK